MSDISPKARKVVTFPGMFGGACRGAAFALGLAAYGAFSWANTRWRKV